MARGVTNENSVFPPSLSSTDVSRSEKGKKGALRVEKARSFAPEGGMVGEKKTQKYFVKKYGFLLFYSRNSSNFHKNFRSNEISPSLEEKRQKIIIPLNT